MKKAKLTRRIRARDGVSIELDLERDYNPTLRIHYKNGAVNEVCFSDGTTANLALALEEEMHEVNPKYYYNEDCDASTQTDAT